MKCKHGVKTAAGHESLLAEVDRHACTDRLARRLGRHAFRQAYWHRGMHSRGKVGELVIGQGGK